MHQRWKILAVVQTMLVVLTVVAVPVTAQAEPAESPPQNKYALADSFFEDFHLDAHAPGLVYGIVVDGQLAHLGTFGVQDLDSKRPVSQDSLFRIASMTKAFTALTVLKLRDDGLLRLDAPAADYVPELRDWKYPTDDSPQIRVRDLLNHVAGFVTDDPWGDRQQPLPEEDFTRMLRAGVPFSSAPGTRFEYSNFGYALLGRIITNVSKRPYAGTITRTLLQPLGMGSTGFDVEAAPPGQRALGYRWEDDAWRIEPTLGPGVFGAMGGLQTNASDYAKWVAFLLSAWPARNGVDSGPVRRATVRELVHGSNFPRARNRSGDSGARACRQAAAYGMGMVVAMDCDLGLTVSHGGGYPGYGSHVLLLPDRGVGLFVFTNRTYAGATSALWKAAVALDKEGLLGTERDMPLSADLANAYRAVGAIFAASDVAAAQDQLAMNFLLDRDADSWSRELKRLKAEVGDCDTSTAVEPNGALSGEFTWRCGHGRLKGWFLLAPTQPPRIQDLELEKIEP